MSIDFSPMKDVINGMAAQLALFILITIASGFIFLAILRMLKVPRNIATSIASLGMLYVAYKVFIWII
jgi:hypothetical protein